MQDIKNLDKDKRKQYYDTLASLDFEFYVEYTNPNYRHGRHTRYISDLLDKVEKSKNRRFILTMPPQHSKSYTVTETFPSYYLGKNPTDNVIVTAYSDTFAQKFGRKNKEKIRLFGNDVFGVNLGDKQADKEWTVKPPGDERDAGRLIASGIGGQITGEGANLLIIDDPIKNRQEAESKVYRERVWEEWESTLSTRLAEDAIVIVIMTRWHDDDLAGRLIDREGFEVLEFPALAKENDILGRKKNEALWPWKYSRNYLFDVKEKRSSKVWASLYQCSPFIEEGAQFKEQYFRYYQERGNSFVLFDGDKKKRISKNKCVCFQTVDTALKDSEQHDYSIFSTWYLTPYNQLLLYNVYKDRIQVPDLFKTLVNQKMRYNPKIQFIEDKASGIGLIQKAQRKGMTVRKLNADSNKIIRSIEISTLYENGQVFHKQDSSWLNDYEDELNKFPDGEFDDQVDTASYAGIVVERDKVKMNSAKGFFATT